MREASEVGGSPRLVFCTHETRGELLGLVAGGILDCGVPSANGSRVPPVGAAGVT
jgi:hypothetical protein